MRHLRLSPTSPIFLTLLFLLVLGACQWLLPTPTDIKTFYHWTQMGVERGWPQVYNWPDQIVAFRFEDFNVDYPPLLFYLTFPAHLLAKYGLTPTWPSAWINVWFRAPIVLGHILLFVFFYRRKTPAWFLLLNPAVFLMGPLWGQWDILLWGLMFLSFYFFVKRKSISSGAIAALAALCKPQFVLFFPPILLLGIRLRSMKRSLHWVLGFATVWLLLSLPFLIAGASNYLHGISRVLWSDDDHRVLSLSYNLWWLVSHAHLVYRPTDLLFGFSVKAWSLVLKATLALRFASCSFANQTGSRFMDT